MVLIGHNIAKIQPADAKIGASAVRAPLFGVPKETYVSHGESAAGVLHHRPRHSHDHRPCQSGVVRCPKRHRHRQEEFQTAIKYLKSSQHVINFGTKLRQTTERNSANSVIKNAPTR